MVQARMRAAKGWRFHSGGLVCLPLQVVGWVCRSRLIKRLGDNLPNSQNRLKGNAARMGVLEGAIKGCKG